MLWIHDDPTLMVERQTAGGNDAVDVRMVLHFLSPGMEHAEEADLSAYGQKTRPGCKYQK